MSSYQIHKELEDKVILQKNGYFYEYKEFEIQKKVLQSQEFQDYIEKRSNIKNQQNVLNIQTFVSDTEQNCENQRIGVIFEPVLDTMEKEVNKRKEQQKRQRFSVYSTQNEYLESFFWDEEEINITLQDCLLGLKNIHDQGLYVGNLKLENIVINNDCEVKIADYFYQSGVKTIIKYDQINQNSYTQINLIDNMSKQLEDIYQLGLCFQEIASLGNLENLQNYYSPKLQVMINIMLSNCQEERIDIYDFFNFGLNENESSFQQVSSKSSKKSLFMNPELSKINEVQYSQSQNCSPSLHEKSLTKNKNHYFCQQKLSSFQITEQTLSEVNFVSQQINQSEIQAYKNLYPVFKIEDIVRESFEFVSPQLLQNCSHREGSSSGKLEYNNNSSYSPEQSSRYGNYMTQFSEIKNSSSNGKISEKNESSEQNSCSSSGKSKFQIFMDKSDAIKEQIQESLKNEQNQEKMQPLALTNILNSIKEGGSISKSTSRQSSVKKSDRKQQLKQEKMDKENQNKEQQLKTGLMSKLDQKFQLSMNKSKLLREKCEKQKQNRGKLTNSIIINKENISLNA